MPKNLRFSTIAIEEREDPRPHYRVGVRGTVTSMQGSCDHTAGLLSEEVVITVHLSTNIGSDMAVIKEAASARALALLDTLVSACKGDFDAGAAARQDAVEPASEAPMPDAVDV